MFACLENGFNQLVKSLNNSKMELFSITEELGLMIIFFLIITQKKDNTIWNLPPPAPLSANNLMQMECR